MKSKRILMVLFLVGLVLGTVIVLRWGHPDRQDIGQETQGAYYCPMHPGYTSDRPGDCPICNMRLVKREETIEEGGKATPLSDVPGYAVILISPEKLQTIGVKTAVVAQKELVKIIRTAGRIAFDPEFYQAQQNFILAVQSLERAQQGGNTEQIEQALQLVHAGRMRLRLLGASDSLIDAIGHWQAPDEALLVNDASGRVWVYATIYEFELPTVREGDILQIQLPHLQGQVVEAPIVSIDPILDPTTRSARARAILTAPELLLKPETFVNVSIAVPLGKKLAIAEEAIFDTGTRKIVFVAKGKGLFEPREVTVGAEAQGDREIVAGLSEGEEVVVSANFLIDSESRLKSALEGMGPTGHQHGQ